MLDLPHSEAATFDEKDFRLLFLDIDDVINSVKTAIVHGKYPFPEGVRKQGGPLLLNDPPVRHSYAFDRTNIQLIAKICLDTKTHIVLSSSWRIGFNVDQIQELLASIGFDRRRVIGRTTEHGIKWSRGDEIEHFLTDLSEGCADLVSKGLILPEFKGKKLTPQSYVILDDMDDMMESQAPNFVQVAPYEGFTLQDAIKMCRILLKNEKFTHNDFKFG